MGQFGASEPCYRDSNGPKDRALRTCAGDEIKALDLGITLDYLGGPSATVGIFI